MVRSIGKRLGQLALILYQTKKGWAYLIKILNLIPMDELEKTLEE